MGRNVKIKITAGAMAVIMGSVLVLFCLLFNLISEKGIYRIFFPPHDVQAVAATMAGIDDTALLECAVYRVSVVYPYDFPGRMEEPIADLGKHDFCVITARITAGYDLTGQPPSRVEGDDLVVSLGKPVITSFTVEDGIRRDGDFPDVKMTPEQWGLIVEDIRPIVKQMALDRGIMGDAEKFGRDLLSKLFRGAGYGQIIFTE